MTPRTRALLGSYVLGGRIADPTPVTAEVAALEAHGIGSAWLSERYATKDLGAMCGAVAATTRTIDVVAGVTHFGTRHPLVMTSWGMTMQALSGNRFQLGFGRGVASRWPKYGLPVPTLRSMEDFAGIYRRLWAGEVVSYEGPAGSFPQLHLPDLPPANVTPPPMLLAAIGPATLRLAGRAFDGVILHPFLTPDGVRRSAQIVRDAAVDSGRDASEVRVISTVVTAPDLTEAQYDAQVRGRAASYLYGVGLSDALVKANGWDPTTLNQLRAQDVAAELRQGNLSTERSHAALHELGHHVPAHWLADAAAVGSPIECARTLHSYFDSGADRILLHGVLIDRLGPTLDTFDELAAQPSAASAIRADA